MPACRATAAAVKARHALRRVWFSICVAASPSARVRRSRRACSLHVFGAATLAGRSFVISLPPSFICTSELLFLLIHRLAAAVHPLSGLLPRLARAITHIFAAFFGLRAQRLASLAARPRRIQNPGQRSQT